MATIVPAGGSVPTGSMVYYPAATGPRGWLPVKGQQISEANHPNLTKALSGVAGPLSLPGELVTEFPSSGNENGMRISNNDLLAVSDTQQGLLVYEVGSWQLINSDPAIDITDMQFSHNGDYLAVVYDSKIVKVFNTESWGLDFEFQANDDNLEYLGGVKFSPNGLLFIGVNAGYGGVDIFQVYELGTWERLSVNTTFDNDSAPENTVFSADGEYVFFSVKGTSPDLGSMLVCFETRTWQQVSADFSRVLRRRSRLAITENYLAVADNNGGNDDEPVLIYDISDSNPANWAVVKEIDVINVYSLAFHNGYLSVARDSYTLSMVHKAYSFSGAEVAIETGLDDATWTPRVLEVSRNGKYLAFFDVSKGARVVKLRTDPDPGHAFMPDLPPIRQGGAVLYPYMKA